MTCFARAKLGQIALEVFTFCSFEQKAFGDLGIMAFVVVVPRVSRQVGTVLWRDVKQIKEVHQTVALTHYMLRTITTPALRIATQKEKQNRRAQVESVASTPTLPNSFSLPSLSTVTSSPSSKQLPVAESLGPGVFFVSVCLGWATVWVSNVFENHVSKGMFSFMMILLGLKAGFGWFVLLFLKCDWDHAGFS